MIRIIHSSSRMPAKFIAELCQNHNGDQDTLHQLIDSAAANGATHIKIQHIYCKNLAFRPQFENGLVSNGQTLSIKRPFADEHARLKKLELSDSQVREFVSHVRSLGLVPMTTCFARGDLQTIYDQGFEEIKIASYDCASYQLLREASSIFSHVYVSTGATFDDEIVMAADILSRGSCDYTFLHCVTKYPTPLSDAHLKRMEFLSKLSSSFGYSDHSSPSDTALIASKTALYLGASVLERHYTILGVGDTKDGPVSILPEHLRQLADFSSLDMESQLLDLQSEAFDWQLCLGDISRDLTSIELLNRSYYRGRFASPRSSLDGQMKHLHMINNWEETPI